MSRNLSPNKETLHVLRRRYPDRTGTAQSAPKQCIRLSPDAVVALSKLNQAIEEKWGKDQAPSISMMISKALNVYAERITYSPERLAAAYEEFVAESRTRQDDRL
jgi:hypothetical protein